MNVKEGDLAILINANQEHADCIGRIVKVVRWFDEKYGWVIEFVGSLPASVPDDRDNAAEDKYLRPVSGLPDTTTTDTEQPIKEIA